MSAYKAARALFYARGQAPIAAPLLTRGATVPAVYSACRPYHASGARAMAYKDDQDRNQLKPRPSEGSKSASDDDVAAESDAAFNPQKTSPEAEKKTAGEGSSGNPLDASGANQELSKPQGDQPKQKQSETGKKKRSGTGSPEKNGKAS